MHQNIYISVCTKIYISVCTKIYISVCTKKIKNYLPGWPSFSRKCPLMWILRNSGIAQTQFRKTELRKCSKAIFSWKWLFSVNCACCCFFLRKNLTQRMQSFTFRSAKVLRTYYMLSLTSFIFVRVLYILSCTLYAYFPSLLLIKELCNKHKYQFLNPYIIATWCRRPLTFETISYVRSNS